MNQPELEFDFPKQRGPLQGVSVLELAHIMAGPVCGLMLADLGADVIKVEPLRGETLRGRGPASPSAFAFNFLNQNKRSITVNLKDSRGLALFKRLVPEADVVLENFAHDTMFVWGFLTISFERSTQN